MIPFSGCSAESSKQTSEPVVINVNNAKKKSVSDYFSPLRYGTTQIFYSFVKENTVLHVMLKNTDTSFPISARVVRFQDGSDEELLNKWISNNYSDAVYTVEKPILDRV